MTGRDQGGVGFGMTGPGSLWLAERGYVGATIGAVASRARAGTKTIYRRYANRAEMLIAAIESGLGLRPVENTGNTVADLSSMLRVLVQSMLRGPGLKLLSAAVVEESGHPELLAAYRRQGVWPRRRVLRAVLERGVRRGELRDDVDLDIIVDLLWGAVFARYMSGAGDEDEFIGGVLDVVLRGIERPGGGSEVEMDYDPLR